MTIPQVTILEIKIQQVSISGNTILCEVFLNDTKFCLGIQNALYPIPLGGYRAYPFLGNHKNERLLLMNVKGHKGVEVHEANWYWQLKGCTAVGSSFENDELINSVSTLKALLTEVHKYSVCFVTLSRSSAFLENKERV